MVGGTEGDDMKKLPEFLALGIGFGFLSLAGIIAWNSTQEDRVPSPRAEVLQAEVDRSRVGGF